MSKAHLLGYVDPIVEVEVMCTISDQDLKAPGGGGIQICKWVAG